MVFNKGSIRFIIYVVSLCVLYMIVSMSMNHFLPERSPFPIIFSSLGNNVETSEKVVINEIKEGDEKTEDSLDIEDDDEEDIGDDVSDDGDDDGDDQGMEGDEDDNNDNEENVLPEYSEEVVNTLSTFFSDEEDSVYIWVLTDTHIELDISEKDKEACKYVCGDKTISELALKETIEYMFDIAQYSKHNDFSVFYGGDIGFIVGKNPVEYYQDLIHRLFKSFQEDKGWIMFPVMGNHERAGIFYQNLFPIYTENVTGIKNENLVVATKETYTFPLYDNLDIIGLGWIGLTVLKQLLSQAKDDGKKVLIVSHVPATSYWHGYSNEFFETMDEYRDVVIDMSFSGHDHTHFFYTATNGGSDAFHTAMIMPSFGIAYSYPGLGLVKYNRKEEVVEDVMIFSNTMMRDKWPRNDEEREEEKPFKKKWSPMFTYAQRYNKTNLSAPHMLEIRDYIIHNDEELTWFAHKALTMDLYHDVKGNTVCLGKVKKYVHTLDEKKCKVWVYCKLTSDRYAFTKCFEKTKL